MKFLQVLSFHVKRIFKSPALLGMLVLFPAILVIVLLFLVNNSGKNTGMTLIAVPDSALFVEKMGEQYEDSVVDEAEGIQMIADRKAVCLYVIPENLGKEKINIYSLDGKQRDVVLEARLEEVLLEEEIRQIFTSRGLIVPILNEGAVQLEYTEGEIDSGLLSAALVILMAMMINSTLLAGDLIGFKENRVLRRLVATPNSSGFLMGSHLGSFLLFIVVFNLIILTGVVIVQKLDTSMLRTVVVNIVAMAFVSSSAALTLFRLFKKTSIALIAGNMITIALIALALLPMQFMGNQLIETVSYLSPLRWCMQSIDRNQLFPHILVLLLYGGVLFTAGSYKLENYVSK